MERKRDVAEEIAAPHAQFAVWTDRLSVKYGKFKALSDVTLQVPVGAIYGLLGPSGCGKTTMLNCLLARIKPSSGTVKCFDRTPGSGSSEVPGRQVGYMPQEIALYEEFTVHEHMVIYGRLNAMTSAEIQEREQVLIDFLELPADGRLVGTFSGGQQRRVSLAIALLHQPRLILLDEPTVGVDPLLRTKIWKFLREVAGQGTSVIITTHYIEEARQADLVGFMRNGRLLEEGTPDALIAKYKQSTLEDTFLHICHSVDSGDASSPKPVEENGHGGRDPLRSPLIATAQRKAHNINNSTALGHVTSEHVPPAPDTAGAGADQTTCCTPYTPRWRNVSASVWKNSKRQLRNKPFLLFQFLLPALQVTLFCLAIGQNPRGITLGVVQEDYGPIGKQYVSYLDQYDLRLNMYSSVDQAAHQVRTGNAWGYVYIPSNFSLNLMLRFTEPNPSPAVLNGSTILYVLDMSNEQISVFIVSSISEAFGRMIEAAVGTKASSPVQMGPPIYGSKDAKFTDFIAPGIIITIAFSQSIGLTAIAFVMDRRTGNLARTWASGVRPIELMISQSMSQLVTLTIQMSLLLTVALAIFKLPLVGSVVLMMLLSICLALTGMMYGLVIAAVSTSEVSATTLALGSFFPALLLSGTIWPVEAVPSPLIWVSYALPTTWAADAMRSIMSRGWGLSEFQVWMGFAVTGGWCVVLFVIALRSLRVAK